MPATQTAQVGVITTTSAIIPLPFTDNLVPVYFNDPKSPNLTRRNQLMTDVTICVHGTTQCQTIDGVMVDSQSSGLRLFRSLVTIPTTLTPTPAGGTLAECESYGDGSSDWGPLINLDVKLGNEPAVAATVQMIDTTFATPPPQCSTDQSIPDTTPNEARLNGVLGVSVLVSDCGAYCETEAQNSVYFSCTNAGCQSITWPEAKQNGNPIRALPIDNNGMSITLGAAPASGTTAVFGTMILGIGTRNNNLPKAQHSFSLDQDGALLVAIAGGTPITALFDSGTNFSIVPQLTTIPACGGAYPSLYCPTQVTTVPLIFASANGSGSAASSITIANAEDFFNSSQTVTANIDAIGTQSQAVFGISYLLGKTVYFGIEGTTSPFGTGPTSGF